jgi:hypothetical protein
MHFILNRTTVTYNNFTKLCIKSPDVFQCSWPLLGLDTPSEIFYYIKMAVDIYDIIQKFHVIVKNKNKNHM